MARNLKKYPKKPNPIPVTRETYEKAERDYEKLKAEEADVLVRLQDAREMGDLSENGAYKYAKFELGNVRRKLGELGRILRYGEIVESSGSSVVEFGCRVVVDDGSSHIEYQMVGVHESNPMEKKLSVESPMGSALMGLGVGDEILVEVPAGKKKLRVVKIS